MAVQFCRECNNLLYPKTEGGILQYVCNRCETTADPNSPVVVSINMKSKHATNNTLKQYLVQDITLPQFNFDCNKCGNNECVSYMDKSEERALSSYYVCTKCYNEWTD